MLPCARKCTKIAAFGRLYVLFREAKKVASKRPTALPFFEKFSIFRKNRKNLKFFRNLRTKFAMTPSKANLFD